VAAGGDYPTGHVLAHFDLVHDMPSSVEVHAALGGDGEGMAASVVLAEEGEGIASGYDASAWCCVGERRY